MIEDILFFAHYALLLAYGITLSLAFAKVSFSRQNLPKILVIFVFCGSLQLITYLFSKDVLLWEIYPLISHLPIIVILWRFYKRRLVTAIAATTTAYLCCQPAKIMGEFTLMLTKSVNAEYSIRIFCYLVFAFILLKYFCNYIAEIFTRNDRSIYTFAFLPLGFYIYEYLMGIYTDLWYTSNPFAREILPLFVFIIFVTICVTYYREYALREYSEQREQLILTTVEQQRKEIDAIKVGTKEIRLMRHDMRLILNNVAACLEDDNKDKALELISGFTTHIDNTVIKRYCENETFNYVIAAFEAKCQDSFIEFVCDAEIGDVQHDEIMLSSILSNALDNAYNAQMELPKSKRKIMLLFKHAKGKILLSVKNPFATRPVFVDGLPVAKRSGHGYGTKSIQYTTEKLGGNCQFTVQDELFVARIVL